MEWETGIGGTYDDAARSDGVRLDEALILSAYADIEPVVERERYRRYRDVLGETATRVANALGWRVSYAGFLADSLASWTPFADTNAALERLRGAGIKLGILSN